MAAVHSIKWKLALNMLRAAAESKSVSLGRQWREEGTGAGNRDRDRRKPSPRDMKSLLTRQQQPSLRHFRSFSVPHPSDPFSPVALVCPFAGFPVCSATLTQIILYSFACPCGNCYPGYPPDYLPACPVPQQQPLLEKVSAT